MHSSYEVDHCGMRPATAASLTEALATLQAQGAVIVEGIGPEEADSRQLVHDLFAEDLLAVPPATRVFDGGEKDDKGEIDNTVLLPPHTDGFGYGDHYPDYIVLTSVKASDGGGDSFLIDGYAVLEALANHPTYGWVAEALSEVAMDQTEAGMQAALSPIVQLTSRKRRLLRKTVAQRPAANSADPARDADMLRIWHAAVDAAVAAAPKFKLTPGQAVVVDNYRMLHGRLAYEDMGRMMWRVWVWTTQSLAGPPDMPLHSDTRYARA